MRAYWRDDLEDQGIPPCSSIPIPLVDWYTLYFEVIENIEPINDTYDMVIQHPKTGELIYVSSKHFNYEHKE